IKIISPTDFPVAVPLLGYPEIKLVMAPYGRLKRMIDAFRSDHIHVATEGPLGWAGRKYCIRHNIAFTTSYHTHFPDYVAKRLAKHVPFLYGTVHNLAKRLVRHFHAPAYAMMVATQSLEDELKSWQF